MKESIYKLKFKFLKLTVDKFLNFGDQRSTGSSCKKIKVVTSSKLGSVIWKCDDMLIGSLTNNFDIYMPEDIKNRRVCGYWIEDNYLVIKVYSH